MLQCLISKGAKSDYTIINSSFKSYNFPAERQIIIDVPEDAYTGTNINLNALNKLNHDLPPSITNLLSDKNKHYIF